MDWNSKVKENFNELLVKIPLFHRVVTEEAVIIRAEELAKNRKAKEVEEQDVVEAFFSEVPAAFYSMMIRLFEQSKIDYKKYGFPKDGK